MNVIIGIALVLVTITILVGVYGIVHGIKGQKAKQFMGMNLSGFIILILAATVLLFSGSTASANSEVVNGVASNVDGMRFLAAALSTGLACVGAGIAVAVSGSAAIGAISEDEKILGKTIIFVGLAEGIAIYGMIISIMILNQ